MDDIARKEGWTSGSCVKEFFSKIKGPHIVEGAQAMLLSGDDLADSDVYYMEQPRDTAIKRLMQRGYCDHKGRVHRGKPEIERMYDKRMELANSFKKNVKHRVLKP